MHLVYDHRGFIQWLDNSVLRRFVPYSGEGFALLLPSKYNPSREKEYPGQTLRCASPCQCSLRLGQGAGPLQCIYPCQWVLTIAMYMLQV